MIRAILAAALLSACASGAATNADPLVASLQVASSPLARANAYFSLACYVDAERWAMAAFQSDERSLEAQYLIAASRAASGDYDGARTVATTALSGADADAPGHIRSALIGLLVAINLESGDARGVEQILLDLEPQLAQAASGPIATSFETLPAPPHAIQYLAIIRELAGDKPAAGRLRAHLTFITPQFLAERAGGSLRPADHWILASVGAGGMTAQTVAARLEAAWAGGFQEAWPFNFGMHATFFPFRGSPEFGDLFDRIEADVAIARSTAFGFDAALPAGRGFNGMAIGARDCGGAAPK